MTDIQHSPDCGHSPRNRFIEQIAIALMLGDVDFLEQALAKDCRWTTTTGEALEGNAILAHLASTKAPPEQIAIDHVTGHGKVGAVNGSIRKGRQKKEPFCHVVTFTTTRCKQVQHLQSYGRQAPA